MRGNADPVTVNLWMRGVDVVRMGYWFEKGYQKKGDQSSDEALAKWLVAVALPVWKGCSLRTGGTKIPPRPISSRTCGCM